MLYEVVYEQKMHPSVTKQQLHRGAAQAGHLHAISLSTRAPALYLGRTGQVLIAAVIFSAVLTAAAGTAGGKTSCP